MSNPLILIIIKRVKEGKQLRNSISPSSTLKQLKLAILERKNSHEIYSNFFTTTSTPLCL